MLATKAEVRTWLSSHQGHQVRPLDITFGVVQVITDEGLDPVVMRADGALEYEPAGETDILWDSQTTVGLVCDDDYAEILCAEWVADVFGKVE